MKRQLLPLLFAILFGFTPRIVFSQSVFTGSILDDAMIKSLGLSESQIRKIVNSENDFQKKTDDLQKDISRSSEPEKKRPETLTNESQEYIETILRDESEDSSVKLVAGFKMPKCRHIYQPKIYYKVPKLKIGNINIEDYWDVLMKKYMTLPNSSTSYIVPSNPKKMPNFDIRGEFSAKDFFRRLEKKYTTWTHCYSAKSDVLSSSAQAEILKY